MAIFTQTGSENLFNRWLLLSKEILLWECVRVKSSRLLFGLYLICRVSDLITTSSCTSLSLIAYNRTHTHLERHLPFLTAGHSGSHMGSFKVDAVAGASCASPKPHVFPLLSFWTHFVCTACLRNRIFVSSFPRQASIVGMHVRACRQQLSHEPCQACLWDQQTRCHPN